MDFVLTGVGFTVRWASLGIAILACTNLILRVLMALFYAHLQQPRGTFDEAWQAILYETFLLLLFGTVAYVMRPR